MDILATIVHVQPSATDHTLTKAIGCAAAGAHLIEPTDSFPSPGGTAVLSAVVAAVVLVVLVVVWQ